MENPEIYYDFSVMTRDDMVLSFPQTNNKWKKKPGYEIDGRALIRSLILSESKLGFQRNVTRSVREFWYQLKPTIARAVGEKVNNFTGDYIDILSDLVKSGDITYSSVGVRDFTTPRKIHENINKARCWTDIQLFVEKDAAYQHLVGLQEFLNINIMSGSGFSKTAAIEDHLRLMQDKGVTEISIFALTDHDPFGFAIYQEFVNKSKQLGFDVKYHQRIGIGPEHISPEMLDVLKYPIKQETKLTIDEISFDEETWTESYGIGGPYGLEIEAVSAQTDGPSRIRDIVATELLKYLDENDRIHELIDESWDNAPQNAVKNILYSIDGWTTYHYYNEPVKEFPETYYNFKEYSDMRDKVDDEKNKTTERIRKCIASVNKKLDRLNKILKKIEKPYDEKNENLRREYRLSRHILGYILHSRAQEIQDEYDKDDYDMGYPPGCVLDAVKERESLREFINKLEESEIVGDLEDELNAEIVNGKIKPLIDEIMRK